MGTSAGVTLDAPAPGGYNVPNNGLATWLAHSTDLPLPRGAREGGMAEEQRLEWEALPTEELVEELEYVGLRLPLGLVEEILRRGKDALEPLGRRVADASLWESDGDERWAPLHALHLLGAIGEPAAVGFILDALRINPEPDEIIENTPTVLGHLGPEVIPELSRFILDESVDGLMRGVACDGLVSIAVLHPEHRDEVARFLRRFVEEAAQHDREAVTAAILSLVELRDKESRPAIAAAFRSGHVDTDLVTLEDVHEAFQQPERVCDDWHFTGDPLEFFQPERLEKMRSKE